MDGQTWRRLKRIEIVVFENLLAQQFFKVHFLFFETLDKVWSSAWETYLFDTKLWFCHSHVISQVS